MAVIRRDEDFESRGTRCAAWLYRPTAAAEDPPVVVMAHGFGCERRWRLPAFAERYAENGIAVLLFDYRYFGDSDGRPRNLISPTGQVRDWLAAIDHVRRLDDVDVSRLGLWGDSFGAGHAISAAARDGDVDAVVLAVPFSDGLRTALHVVRAGGIPYFSTAIRSATRDLARRATFRTPYYVPIAAAPDEFGVLNRPEALAGFRSINGGEWDNRCPARILLTILGYRPITRADGVDCPALVVEAEADRIIPPGTTDRLVTRLPDVERVRYPIHHFDIFTGEPFETVADRTTAFLDRHLLA